MRFGYCKAEHEGPGRLQVLAHSDHLILQSQQEPHQCKLQALPLGEHSQADRPKKCHFNQDRHHEQCRAVPGDSNVAVAKHQVGDYFAV